MIGTTKLLTIKEASKWASGYIGKNVTTSNIAYLIQYGLIKKFGENGSTQIDQNDLINYYQSYNGSREINFKERLGNDLNWALSFDQYKEAETTKHVHRLHPYKGKFIPQLVEYFLDKWYSQHVRDEIDFVFEEIKKIQSTRIKKIISIILSRTIRSCRATTHADLATLLEPVTTTYYCHKHGKICKPLFSIMKWWKTYSKDTINRLQQFNLLRTNTFQLCLTGDSRNIDIFEQTKTKNPAFAQLLENQKIKGIFSSPPYVGLIDYHEQHAYAYDLFGFDRKDELEIGPLFKGQTKEAKQSYIQGISAVLNNCKRFMVKDYDVFFVANDKYNMYPIIAENAGMKIVNQFKRPVLNRTEKDKTAYSESIFHLKQK